MAKVWSMCLSMAVGFAVGAVVGFSARAVYVKRRNRRQKTDRGRGKVSAVGNRKEENQDQQQDNQDDDGQQGQAEDADKSKFVKHELEYITLTDRSKIDAAARSTTLIQHHSQASHLPECFLMLHHVSKNRNVGSLLRTATAFGCTAVICVGLRKVSQLNFFGAHGSDKRIKVLCFLYMDEAVQFLRERAKSQGRKKCHIVGLEITPNSKLLPDPQTFAAFTNATPEDKVKVDSICIIPGNEGSGLTDKDREFCDYCVVIPQYGSATASLNVCSATAILLYQFAVAAGFGEAAREGEKYSISSWTNAQIALKDQGFKEPEKKKKEDTQSTLSDGDEEVDLFQ